MWNKYPLWEHWCKSNPVGKVYKGLLVSEADRLKHSERKQAVPGTVKGSRPVRKRGYHRALKKRGGVLWAALEHSNIMLLAHINRELYNSVKPYRGKYISNLRYVLGAHYNKTKE